MKANKITVEDRFITELVAHPTFQTEIQALLRKSIPQPSISYGSSVPSLV